MEHTGSIPTMAMINDVLARYRQDIAAEMALAIAEENARQSYEMARAQVVLDAIDSGLVNGKSAEIRKIQIENVVNKNAGLDVLRDGILEARKAREAAAVDSKVTEKRISLLRAYMIMLSNIVP